MRTKSLFLLIVLILIGPLSVFCQNAGFTGEWKLDRVKTALTDNQLFLSKITVMVKRDSLLTTRVYENANGEEYPFVENLGFDGKENQITIYDMPRSSKASRVMADGTIMIESKTTFNGQNGVEDMIANETWKVLNEGNILSIVYINKMSGNEYKGTNFYTRTR